MPIRTHHPLQALNTLRVAAYARYFTVLDTLAGLASVQQWQAAHPDLPVLWLGGGSNVLFVQDFPGLVVQVALAGKRCLGADTTYTYVQAAAGENWHGFVQWTLSQGWAGLENLSLIPGTVGAAPIQNIGAYGVELQDHVHTVQAVDWRTGTSREFTAEACRFAYRDSHFKSGEPGRWLITTVNFRLPQQPVWKVDYAGVREQLAGQELSARAISDAIMALRRSKLPDPAHVGNAGSFFKNPVLPTVVWEKLKAQFPTMPGWTQADGVKVSAAWLIEQCGWKGKRVGDAGVAAQHALVLVNHGNATGAQLWQLAQDIIVSVQDKFGITLEPEPNIIGG